MKYCSLDASWNHINQRPLVNPNGTEPQNYGFFDRNNRTQNQTLNLGTEPHIIFLEEQNPILERKTILLNKSILPFGNFGTFLLNRYRIVVRVPLITLSPTQQILQILFKFDTKN